MDQGALDFWLNHSEQFLEMAFQVDRRETLERPDGYGRATRECGDTVEIFLTVGEGRIQSVSFETNGCLYSVACANTAAHLAEGKSLDEAAAISAQSIISFLETLPEDENHCAALAVRALRAAVESARQGARPRELSP